MGKEQPEFRFKLRPLRRWVTTSLTDLGKLKPSPRAQIVVSRDGISFPFAQLGMHQYDHLIDELKPRPRGTIPWKDLHPLQIKRDHFGDFEFVFGEEQPIQVIAKELKRPAAFQSTVERLSGKRFEKAYSEAPVLIDDDQSDWSALMEMQIPVEAKTFAVIPAPRVGSELLGMLGCLIRIAIVIAAMTGLAVLFPDQATKLLDSPLGFVGLMLIILAAIAMPWLWTRKKTEPSSFLAVAAEGLYAQLPSRSFPRFTPWSAVQDFTMPDKRRGTGFTLYTNSGAYGMRRCSISDDFVLYQALVEKLHGPLPRLDGRKLP